MGSMENNTPTVLIWKNKCWESRGSNLGDLAIITATIEAMKRALPEIDIIMLSDDPNHTASLYGIRALPIGIGGILRAVREADMVLLGGGTVFTDVSSKAIIVINTSLLYLSRFYRTPIATYAIGTGRMSRLGAWLVRHLLPAFTFCTVRDDESRRDLISLCSDVGTRTTVTEDAAFSLRPATRPAARDNCVVISPRRIFHYANSLLPFYIRKRLGLLPAGYSAKLDSFKTLLAEVADFLVCEHGARIRFLPMYSAMGEARGISGYLKSRFSARDDVICDDILSRMRHGDRADVFLSDSPMDVLTMLTESRLVIGVPLHSLILAHVAETPFVGLSYQEKVARFMRRCGMERFMIDVASIDCVLNKGAFIATIESCLAEEDRIRDMLRASNIRMKDVVDRPAGLIADFFEARRVRRGRLP